MQALQPLNKRTKKKMITWIISFPSSRAFAQEFRTNMQDTHSFVDLLYEKHQ